MQVGDLLRLTWLLTRKNAAIAKNNLRFWVSVVSLPIVLALGAAVLTNSFTWLSVSPYPTDPPSLWGGYPAGTPLPVIVRPGAGPMWSPGAVDSVWSDYPRWCMPPSSDTAAACLPDSILPLANYSGLVGLMFPNSTDGPPTRRIAGGYAVGPGSSAAAVDLTVLFDADVPVALPVLLDAFVGMVLSWGAGNGTVSIGSGIAPVNNARVDHAFTWLMFGPLLMSYAIGFFAAAFTSRVVEERASGTRDLLQAMGMPLRAWWASFFLFHYVIWVFVGMLSLLILVAFGVGPVVHNTILAPILLIMATGASLLAHAYLLSFLFSSPETCARVLRMVITMIVVVPYIIVTVVLDNPSSVVIQTLLSIVPTYALFRGWALLGLYEYTRAPLDAAGIINFDKQFIELIVVQLFMSKVAFSVIAAIERSREWRETRSAASDDDVEAAALVLDSVAQDEDVVAEAARIAAHRADGAASLSDDVLVVDAVTKVYGSGETRKVAVNNVSFGVGPGDILGLVGTNGAGKSTLIKMLAKEVSPTGGSLRVDGRLGLCPQVDALWGELSGRAHLGIYAAVKGVPASEVDAAIATVSDPTGLASHLDAATATYSGGTRRKLSLAIAFIGSPDVLLLDEVSAGVDIEAMHGIWQMVRELKGDSAIVLTSHALQEIEALCSRVCMLAGGTLRCIGTVPHLKTKFGSSVRFVLTAADGRVDDVTAALDATFPHGELVQVSFENIVFQVPRESAPLSTLIRTLVSGVVEATGAVLDYSVSNSSLESVFLEVCRTSVAP